MLAGLANGRTVNLSHLASQFPGKALHASSYRRLQRFFQHVRLDGDVVAQLIFRLPDLRGPQLLALDRTNWKLGKTDINILVLAIVTRRFKVPLMWSFLSHRGNSSTRQRIDLIERYLRVFGVSSIEALLADREFVGDGWMTYLIEKMFHSSFDCVRTCTSKPKIGGRFNFARCCANGARENGRAGFVACSVRRKIDCVSKGEKSGVANCFWSPRISPLPKMHCASIERDGELSVSLPTPKPVASTLKTLTSPPTANSLLCSRPLHWP